MWHMIRELEWTEFTETHGIEQLNRYHIAIQIELHVVERYSYVEVRQ